jgi:hypothetical protein
MESFIVNPKEKLGLRLENNQQSNLVRVLEI